MYAPLSQMEAATQQQPQQPPQLLQQLLQQQQQQQSSANAWKLKLVCYAALLGALTLILMLTYQTCVMCVLGIAVISLLLIQVPFMPIVFGLSMFVLLYHSVDYRSATVKVEVPLSNFVYVPTVDDFRKYVHMSAEGADGIKSAAAVASSATPQTTTTPLWRPYLPPHP